MAVGSRTSNGAVFALPHHRVWSLSGMPSKSAARCTFLPREGCMLRNCKPIRLQSMFRGVVRPSAASDPIRTLWGGLEHTSINGTAEPRFLTALDVARQRRGVLAGARCAGLRLVAMPKADRGGIVKSGICRYRRRYRARGQIKLGQSPRMPAAEAGDARAEAQARRVRAYTVRDLLEDDLRLHAAQLAKGAGEARMSRHDVLPLWGRRSAADVTARDVVDLAEKIAKRPPARGGHDRSRTAPGFRDRDPPLATRGPEPVFRREDRTVQRLRARTGRARAQGAARVAAAREALRERARRAAVSASDRDAVGGGADAGGADVRRAIARRSPRCHANRSGGADDRRRTPAARARPFGRRGARNQYKMTARESRMHGVRTSSKAD